MPGSSLEQHLSSAQHLVQFCARMNGQRDLPCKVSDVAAGGQRHLTPLHCCMQRLMLHWATGKAAVIQQEAQNTLHSLLSSVKLPVAACSG